jgi:DNA-directed RNA polymerase subunit N (RpoN/RPB10)
MIPIECYDCGKYMGYIYDPNVQGSVKEIDGKFIRCNVCYPKFELIRNDIHHSTLVQEKNPNGMGSS